MTNIVFHVLANAMLLVFIDLNYCAAVLQNVVSNIAYPKKCQISKNVC